MKSSKKSLSFYYRFGLKFNSVSGTYKLVRAKIDKATDKLISTSTVRKGIQTRPEADQALYLAERTGKF
jgi:hypothetical protein